MGLGDDLMWLGEASKVHDQHPDAYIHDGQGFSPMWENVPWVCHPNHETNREKIFCPPKPGGQRWYVDRFADGRVYFKDYQPIPAPYTVSDEERAEAIGILEQNDIYGPFVLVNPDTKNTTLASNKDWGFERWTELTKLLSSRCNVVRLKPENSIRDVSGFVEYKQPELAGAFNIHVDDVRLAFAIASLAECIITPEGGLHHLAAALNIPALVVYGGVIHPRYTGYTNRNQRYYYYDDPLSPCGRQYDCDHCRESMDAIPVSLIFKDCVEILATRNQSVTADQ